MPVAHSFLLMSNIPFRRHTTACLAVCLLVDIWFVSSFSQLNIKQETSQNELKGIPSSSIILEELEKD